MFGAAVVIVLAGMLIPISMLVAAIVFDAAVVAWVVFQEWHDHWSPRLARLAQRTPRNPHRAPRHRAASLSAH
jgi:hypothetical protein